MFTPSITISSVHALNSSKTIVGPNIDISTTAGRQNEVSVAINPENPSQVVAVAIDFSNPANSFTLEVIRGYFSSDGGATWGNTPLPVPPSMVNAEPQTILDEGVAWDTLGNVYCSYLAWLANPQSGHITASEVVVSKSSDGGRSWTATTFGFQPGEGPLTEKTMIAIDTNPASPFRDNVYVAYDLNLGITPKNPMTLLLSRSTDHGATFSSPVLPAGPTPSGVVSEPFDADPFVGPDGTLYVAWQDSQKGHVAVSSSTDGGLSFGPATTIGLSPTDVSGGDRPWVSIPAAGANGSGALVYPACGADLSTGPHRGTLYCSWMDKNPNSGTDIFVAHSTDHGQTWSQRVRVNDDPTNTANVHFNQWLSVDPTDGRVSLSWRDTRNDPAHLVTNMFYSSSTDGGLTFTPNIQITTAPTDQTTIDAPGYGDYEGIAAFGGVVHPVWDDFRPSVASLGSQIFTANITFKTS
jgi:BNR/Asp-box repeat protein